MQLLGDQPQLVEVRSPSMWRAWIVHGQLTYQAVSVLRNSNASTASLLNWLVVAGSHTLVIALPCALQAYQEMQLGSGVPADQRTYCPYPECGFMLERRSDPEEYADKPLECPYCDKPFCVTCGMMGWHKVNIASTVASWSLLAPTTMQNIVNLVNTPNTATTFRTYLAAAHSL